MSSQNNASNLSIDFERFLHPSRAFANPMQVVHDADLTPNEKRAILSSWASDACALEAAHELRLHASGATARWDDIMDALRALDAEVSPPREVYDPKRPWWRQPKMSRRRRGGDPGAEAP